MSSANRWRLALVLSAAALASTGSAHPQRRAVLRLRVARAIRYRGGAGDPVL